MRPPGPMMHSAMRPPATIMHCWPLACVHRAGSICLCSGSTSTNWEEYHVPVLRDETVSWLVSDLDGIYADCTLGGGGHSEAILKMIAPSGGRLVCADRDSEALRQAGKRLAPFVESGAAVLLQTNFGRFPTALERLAPSLSGNEAAGADGLLSGILLDLGVSSHQIDDAERGFSYRFDGPLDMRMDQSSGEGALTAATILNEWEQYDIAEVIWRHGEERGSRMIARALVAARPLTSTAQLALVVRNCAGGPPKELTKRTARVFQALRIEVNREMDELDNILNDAARLLKPGGRLAVMSYHSLEDRKVKKLIRSGSIYGDTPPKDSFGNSLAPWVALTRQPVCASEAEIALNPRARSVRVRVGERTTHPPLKDE